MTVRKKVILALLVVLCALSVSIAGIQSWNYYDSNDYSRQITLGKRYYSAGEYEKAMVRFQRAVNLRPDEEEGYLGLAEIYRVRGDSILADNILLLGSERTGSESLRYMIEGVGPAPTQTEAIYKIDPIFNLNFLQLLTTKTFNEYRLEDRGLSGQVTDDGSCVVNVGNPVGELTFAPTNVDRITGTPDSDSVPLYVSLENIMELFGGAEEVTTDDLEKMGVSSFSVYDDKDHGKVIVFMLENCEFTVSCQENGAFSSNAWNQIKLPEVVRESNDSEASESEDNESWQISGRVVNAVTGNGVSGAHLRFLSVNSGADENSDTVTDNFGIYEVALAEGSYRVEVSCDGFTPEEFSIQVDGGSSMTIDPFIISPILEEGQIRIVLEWGSTPRDLDSYLAGALDNGANVSTYYGSPTSSSGGTLLAELDVDDRDGYGPETTTIYNINGSFTFWVEDFTHTGTMSDSGATVKIYTPQSGSPIVVNICAGCENMWRVCEIDHGNVTVINQP